MWTRIDRPFWIAALAVVALMVNVAAADDKDWDTYPQVDESEWQVLFETADHPMFQHPVLGTHPDLGGSYHQWKNWEIMSMSKAEILKLIPEQVGLLHLGCPECNAGPENAKNDFNDSSQLPRQWGHWRWSKDNPEQYHCDKCGEKFPNNPKYPMNHVDVFRNRLGEKIERRYWLDTAKDKNGFKKRFPKYYLNSQIDYHKMRWVQGQLHNLKDAYTLTGDEAFAYKAAILVDAMCDVFPRWLYMANYAHNYKDYHPGLHMKSTYTRTNSRRGESWTGPIGMGQAYDIFFSSDGWKQYSDEIGVDLRAKYLTHICKFIRPDMFKEGKLEDVGSDGWQQGCPGHGGISTGKLLHDPRYMRRFADHMLRIPFRIYGSDGAYFEGSGYTALQLNPMMQMRDLNGYSDPESFTPPAGEDRIDYWWYPNHDYEDFHRKAYNIQREIALPHGSGVVYNDAGGGFPSASYITRRTKPRSTQVMKHGLKHVVLGDGVGENQIQAHMLFGLDSKHGHEDTMSMQIYAHGHYMVDDITYPKHRMRSTYGQVFLHNSGLIDGRGHAGGPVGDGKPVLYEPRFNGLAAVRVDGENMYPGYDNGVFERTLVNVTVDPERPYVVDLFRMNGGRKWREYMLLGSYRHGAKAELSGPSRKLPGDRPLMRQGAEWHDEGRGDVRYDDKYGLFTNVRAVPRGRDFKLTYTMENAWRQHDDGRPQDLYVDPDKPAVGMVNHFIGMPNATAYLAEIPRRVDQPGSTMDMKQLPQLIYRDEGMNAESQFVCVHEPFKGQGNITDVTRLANEGNTLALLIEFRDGRKDLVLMSTDDRPLDFDMAGVETDARLAVISRPAGGGQPDAWMVGGTHLNARDVALKQEVGQYNGRIVRSFRTWAGDDFNGFEVADLSGPNGVTPHLPPAGDELVGAWIVVDSDGVQQELHDDIINGSIKDWYSKYHSRSRGKYQAAKKKDPDSEYVLDWEADQRRWDNARQAGAGWAFQIKQVIERDGRTFIVTEDDHGLDIDGDQKLARELFFPNRKLEGADTTWHIHTAASTRPMKRMTPRQIIAKPDELDRVKQNLMPYPQQGNRYYHFIEPEDPRDVRAELIVDATDLGVAAPDDARPGIIHFLGSRGYRNGRIVESKYSGYAGVSDGAMREYIFKPKGGRQNFAGHLKVPADGVYTFYYRAGGNGELLVGNQVVSPENDYQGAPYPRVIHVKLKAGYVPFEFWANMWSGKYWSANNEISWQGPGFDRRPMAFNDFVYSQADLDAIAAEVSVNKLGGDDDRYAGIRNDYLAALSYTDGDVYLNGVKLGNTPDSRVWNHSINLQKGDVLVYRAKCDGKHRGAAFTALRKGRPLFLTQDCMMTTQEPPESFYTNPAYEPGLVKATPAGVADRTERHGAMNAYQADKVWHDGAETIWLKFVLTDRYIDRAKQAR